MRQLNLHHQTALDHRALPCAPIEGQQLVSTHSWSAHKLAELWCCLAFGLCQCLGHPSLDIYTADVDHASGVRLGSCWCSAVMSPCCLAFVLADSKQVHGRYFQHAHAALKHLVASCFGQAQHMHHHLVRVSRASKSSVCHVRQILGEQKRCRVKKPK